MGGQLDDSLFRELFLNSEGGGGNFIDLVVFIAIIWITSEVKRSKVVYSLTSFLLF